MTEHDRGKIMRNPDIVCVVRSMCDEGCDYRPAERSGLTVELIPAEEPAEKNMDPVCEKLSAEESGKYTGGTDLTVRITNTSEEDFSGVIHIKLMSEESDPRIFMPGYMYNTNTADKPSSGRKAFPRLKKNPGGMPESAFFMTRSDRLAEPVSLMYGSGRVKGIAAPPYWVLENGAAVPVSFKNGKKCPEHADFLQYGGFSCNIDDNGRVSVGYTLGYEDAPWLFVQTATVLDRAKLSADNSFRIAVGETVEFPVIIYDYEGEDETAIYKALEHTYNIFHETPRSIEGMDADRALELLGGAIRDNAWLEDERMYSGFVYDREKGPRYNKIGSLTWTNGLAVAVPMLMAANRLNDDRARAQSLKFIENVIENSYNPDSGLLYEAVEDGKWSVHGWWYNGMHSGGHSGYLNGQAVYYILMAYLNEKNVRNAVHEDWLDFVAPVIARMNAGLNSDCEYPFAMSEHTGAGIEYDSMGGAWCLAATALYGSVKKDTEYLEKIKKSEQHYYEAFVKKCECYGGPLDTDKAVDNEGILAFIRAVKLLHEMTGEKAYLEHLRLALHYECSFKLCYNTPVSVPPLSTVHWSSCGGSITSVANPHIHPMSSTVIPEMKYYVDATGDAYIASRLEDTVKWSLQTFNTFPKEYGYGGPGWMSERFCFCRGLLTEKYPDGSPASTWFALMPWASASIIEGLAGIQ